MKIKLLSWILLFSLLFCGCAGESALLPTETETVETKETAVDLVTTGEEKKTEEVQTQPATEELVTPPVTEEKPIALRLTEEEKAARNARLTEALKGKRVSFIGDSISTFQGYSNNIEYNATIGKNSVYYKNDRNGFTDVNETWWMQTVKATGMELLVNNSWSGDRVTNRGIARAKQLHDNDGVKPDVIVVYLGINDFRTGVTVREFKTAYDTMIGGMKEAYPEADVYLCDFVYSTGKMSKESIRPMDVKKFNEVVSEIAAKHQASLVEFFDGTGITWKNVAEHMGDQVLHPNYKGMDVMTECVLASLAENYIK